jgi:hypothetical protein
MRRKKAMPELRKPKIHRNGQTRNRAVKNRPHNQKKPQLWKSRETPLKCPVRENIVPHKGGISTGGGLIHLKTQNDLKSIIGKKRVALKFHRTSNRRPQV